MPIYSKSNQVITRAVSITIRTSNKIAFKASSHYPQVMCVSDAKSPAITFESAPKTEILTTIRAKSVGSPYSIFGELL